MKSQEIAIIGIAGRFPDARDIGTFYQNLLQGKDSIRPISNERLRETTLPPGKQYRNAGYLEGIDRFDYKFFNISLGEAQAMDPIQRLLLEVVYNTIENAGYDPASFNGSRTSVFVGDASTEYYKHADVFVDTLITGNSPSFVATRVTRHFNMTGNAVMVNTACSSSGLAIHFACNELKLEEAEVAIACGVNLYLFPYYDNANEMDIWSADGKSRAFSAHAAGMSNGEIVAAVMLKSLDKALADNDHIHAVIKSTAVNNNADRSDSPYAPDSVTQAEVIKMAWQKAGIEAEDIGFIETHGSGTQLGDTLEIEGLTRAFAQYTDRKRFVPISAVKSTMGHGMSGAGIAGLIKSVLAVKHKVLFPTIHSQPPNPLIDFDSTAVYVNIERNDWTAPDGKPRIAGVTTLGASGTNCHVIVQEPPQRRETGVDAGDKPVLVPVSSRTASGLTRNLDALRRWLSQKEDICLSDVGFTLARGRSHFDYRTAIITNSKDQCVAALDRELHRLGRNEQSPCQRHRLVFVFADPDGDRQINHLIQAFDKEFTPFAEARALCGDVTEDTNGNLLNVVFQYSFYRLLEALGVKNRGNDAGDAGDLLGIGLGQAATDIINGDSSLAEGMAEARGYVARDIKNLSSRLQAMVERETAGGPVLFVGMGPKGPVMEGLLHLQREQEHPTFACYDPQFENGVIAEIMALLQQLYLSGCPVDWQAVYNLLPAGQRIELPGYSFEPSRCWLREEPKSEEEADGQTLFNDNEKHLEVKKNRRRPLKEQGSLLEETLAEFWRHVLDIETCSLEDNFFDLGGDSLQATTVARKIKEQLDVDLDFEDMFDFPKLRDLARYVDSLRSSASVVERIWRDVLKETELTSDSNFFDLGGHSLLANQVLLRVKGEWRLDLNFEDFFLHPTLGKFIELIDMKRAHIHEAAADQIPSAPKDLEWYPATSAQKGLWLISRLEGAANAYNTPFPLWLDGDLDREALERALNLLAVRHESLRTIIVDVDGEPMQTILPAMDVRLHAVNVTPGKEEERRTIDAHIEREAETPFSLDQGPLFRVLLMRLEPRRHVLVITAHHIICDGWSTEIFFQELTGLYGTLANAGKPDLVPLSPTYKDFACWQQTWLATGEAEGQLSYWRDVLAEPPAPLDMPLDFPRGDAQSFAGAVETLQLDSDGSRRVRDAAANAGVTVYMYLLAVTCVLLSKLTGQDDMTVGTVVNGRNHAGLQHIVGMFANTLALRCRPQPTATFADFLSNTKTVVLEAFAHQEYPFGELVRRLSPTLRPGHNPLFDVLFEFQEFNQPRTTVGGIAVTPYEWAPEVALFDLNFSGYSRQGLIGFAVEYNVALYKQETVRRMIEYFETILDMVTSRPESPLEEIDVLNSGEENDGAGPSGDSAVKRDVTFNF